MLNKVKCGKSAPRVGFPVVLGMAAIVSVATALFCSCSSIGPDAVTGASDSATDLVIDNAPKESGVLVILATTRNSGTARIANAIAGQLDALVLSPGQAQHEELGDYDLVGFGSGIFDQMHQKALLDTAENLPPLTGRKVFIFSTSGISRRLALDNGIDDPHDALREKLKEKGCVIVDEFNCAGFNDNSFLILFGGMNRGKPDGDDLRHAAAFARGLKDASGFQSGSDH
jgi:hypothetical protein